MLPNCQFRIAEFDVFYTLYLCFIVCIAICTRKLFLLFNVVRCLSLFSLFVQPQQRHAEGICWSQKPQSESFYHGPMRAWTADLKVISLTLWPTELWDLMMKHIIKSILRLQHAVSSIRPKASEDTEIWTLNLLIRGQTRCNCAIPLAIFYELKNSPQWLSTHCRVKLKCH